MSKVAVRCPTEVTRRRARIPWLVRVSSEAFHEGPLRDRSQAPALRTLVDQGVEPGIRRRSLRDRGQAPALRARARITLVDQAIRRRTPSVARPKSGARIVRASSTSTLYHGNVQRSVARPKSGASAACASTNTLVDQGNARHRRGAVRRPESDACATSPRQTEKLAAACIRGERGIPSGARTPWLTRVKSAHDDHRPLDKDRGPSQDRSQAPALRAREHEPWLSVRR